MMYRIINIISKIKCFIFSKIKCKNNKWTYEEECKAFEEDCRKRGVRIGTGCEINRNTSFGSEPYLISLGNKVRTTYGVKFITHDGGLWGVRNMVGEYKNIDLFGSIKVGNNVHIGMDSIIMPGVTIGNNVIIGCGAIVTKDIPDNSVAVGVPAKVIESIDEYITKHKENYMFTKQLNYVDKKTYLQKNMKINEDNN